MLRRTCHLHVVAILNTEAVVVVASGSMRVGIVAVESQARE